MTTAAASRLIERNDELLRPLIEAEGEEERRAALERLIVEQIRPVVTKVVARHARSDRLIYAHDASDIESVVVLRLVERLQAVARDESAAIANVRDFAASVAFNATYDVIRRNGAQRSTYEPAHGAGADPLERLSHRRSLEALWREIVALKFEHRAALLLNLRENESGNAVALLVMSGVATIDEVAQALQMTAEGLAELWNRLPLDDATIAEMLGLRRQQVINLRRTARERLARRIRER